MYIIDCIKLFDHKYELYIINILDLIYYNSK